MKYLILILKKFWNFTINKIKSKKNNIYCIKLLKFYINMLEYIKIQIKMTRIFGGNMVRKFLPTNHKLVDYEV